MLSVVQESLKQSQFLHKICRKMPKTYAEFKIKAFSHASADEYIRARKENLPRRRMRQKERSKTTRKIRNRRKAS